MTNIKISRDKSMAIGTLSLVAALACPVTLAQENASNFVDPTRPVSALPEAVDPVPSGPVLQSTMVAPGVKRAVISGKIYNVGERLGKAVIADIRPYEIVLNQDGRETRLRLVPVLAKETPALS